MNLLITGAWPEAKENIAALEKLGHTVRFLQCEKDALPCPYDWVEGVVCNGLFLTHPIERFSNLKYIQLTSAGFDRVPMDYVHQHKLEIHNAWGVYSIPMAEFAIAGVLQLYKKMQIFADYQKAHQWKKCRNLMELSGKTVCIVGCGSVGTECAKRFSAFGCHVIGVNRTVRENDEYYERMSDMDSLNEELPRADIVVLALPLTDQTRHLLNSQRLSLLKAGAILVNIARGAVVDPKALTAALPNLGGAVLDVFEEEPLDQNSPLWDMENVILTPHNSYAGEGNGERITNAILSNLLEI